MTFKVLSANPNLFERNNSLQNESREITQLSKSVIAPPQLAQNAAARLVCCMSRATRSRDLCSAGHVSALQTVVTISHVRGESSVNVLSHLPDCTIEHPPRCTAGTVQYTPTFKRHLRHSGDHGD